MLVLVTGGTGYVAGWCIAELLHRGYQVRTTVRSLDKAATVTQALADPAGLEFAVADLTDDAGWTEAMKGVDYVLHVASPLGNSGGSQTDLIGPARDGAVRVLRAASEAGVKRVVMTSAANAASPSSYATEGVTDETLWTDPEDPTLIPYRRSKTLAELAAWEFAREHDLELTTVLPGAVFGPILSAGTIGSVSIVQRMISGGMRAVPRIGFEIVDVRDLADVHIRAMTSPDAGGERFLATGEFMWMRDMARTLKDGLGRNVATRTAPDLVVRFTARFLDRSLRDITPALGRRALHSTAKAERVLGWHARPAAETVLDCARSLIDHGAA